MQEIFPKKDMKKKEKVIKKRLVGRPSAFTKKMADILCGELAQGYSLRTVCKAANRPAPSTFFRWLRAVPGFRKQYEEAKQESADAMAEEILDISDDGQNDWMESNAKDNVGWKVNGEHIQRSRLRVDARKWLAAKMKPKKYGEQMDLTSDGEKIVVSFTTGKSPFISSPEDDGEDN
jgi:hypothetical protein